MHFIRVFYGHFLGLCLVLGGGIMVQVGSVQLGRVTRFPLRTLEGMSLFFMIEPLTFSLFYIHFHIYET